LTTDKFNPQWIFAESCSNNSTEIKISKLASFMGKILNDMNNIPTDEQNQQTLLKPRFSRYFNGIFDWVIIMNVSHIQQKQYYLFIRK